MSKYVLIEILGFSEDAEDEISTATELKDYLVQVNTLTGRGNHDPADHKYDS